MTHDTHNKDDSPLAVPISKVGGRRSASERVENFIDASKITIICDDSGFEEDTVETDLKDSDADEHTATDLRQQWTVDEIDDDMTEVVTLEHPAPLGTSDGSHAQCDAVTRILICDPEKLRRVLDLVEPIDEHHGSRNPVTGIILAGHRLLANDDSFAPEGFKDRLKATLRGLRHASEQRDDHELTSVIDSLVEGGGYIETADAEDLDDASRWAEIRQYLFKETCHLTPACAGDPAEVEQAAADLREHIEEIQQLGSPAVAVGATDPRDERRSFPVESLPDPVARFVEEVCTST